MTPWTVLRSPGFLGSSFGPVLNRLNGHANLNVFLCALCVSVVTYSYIAFVLIEFPPKLVRDVEVCSSPASVEPSRGKV